VADLKDAVNDVETAPPGKFKDGMASTSQKSLYTVSVYSRSSTALICANLCQGAIYGMAESIPDRSLVDDLAKDYIDALYTA
jgi:hypothetical protein